MRVYWPDEAVALLQTGQVTEISLDHDLGDDARGTGYDVVLWIEEAVLLRGFVPRGLLLQRGVPAHWARCCVTHGPWAASDALESLCVALADRLWRGARCAELELCVVDAAAQRKGCDRWSIWAPLEDVFEAIAADGPARLQVSRAYPV